MGYEPVGEVGDVSPVLERNFLNMPLNFVELPGLFRECAGPSSTASCDLCIESLKDFAYLCLAKLPALVALKSLIKAKLSSLLATEFSRYRA